LLILAKLASLMMFCFKMRLPSAIVAHSYDRLRTTFLPTLDEALAHCANDAEMFFVCAHINVSLVARCLDCLCREILLPRRKYLEDSTGEHMCIASAEVLNLRIADGRLLFENLGRQISEKNDERRLITIKSTSRKLAAVFMLISLALGSQTVAVGR